MRRLSIALALLLVLPILVLAQDTKDPEKKDPPKKEDTALHIRLYRLKYHNARYLAPLLQRFLGRQRGEQAESDSRTNTVIVATTKKNHEIIGAMIENLDVKQEGEGNLLNRVTRTRPKAEIKLYKIKHLDTKSAARVVQSVGVEDVTAEYESQTLVVRATKDGHARVADLLKQLDKPRPSIEVRVHLLRLSMDGEAKTPAPDDLAGVAKKLLALFKYKHAEQLDTVVAQGLAGTTFSAYTSGSDFRVSGKLRYDADEGRITIERLRVNRRLRRTKGAGQTSYEFSSTVKVRVGKTVAIGASKAAGGSYVLVISARLVDDSPRKR